METMYQTNKFGWAYDHRLGVGRFYRLSEGPPLDDELFDDELSSLETGQAAQDIQEVVSRFGFFNDGDNRTFDDMAEDSFMCTEKGQ